MTFQDTYQFKLINSEMQSFFIKNPGGCWDAQQLNNTQAPSRGRSSA